MPSVSVPTVIAGVGAAAGAGNLINNIAGGGSSSPATGTTGGSPGTYIPQNQGAADQLYQNIFAQESGYASSLPGETIPGYQQYASNIQSNPYAGQSQSGSNIAAGMGTANAANLQGAAGQLYGAGGQVLATGFDPQQNLYNQQINNVQQQSNAANAAAGVSGPAAAGVSDQNTNNFNIAWQNAQLGRQTSALGAAGAGDTAAGNLGNLGYSTEATASNLPYATYLGQQNQDVAALQGLTSGTTGALSADSSLANILQSYLGLGQSATGQAIQGEQASYAQNNQTAGQVGQSLAGLSTLFAPSPNSGGIATSSQDALLQAQTGGGYGLGNYYGGG